ncbi:TPA: hypothetical protein BOS_11950 [Bos taurus]|nr:TPA: hypothetical protein BOS_11950 [Bos taurus]
MPSARQTPPPEPRGPSPAPRPRNAPTTAPQPRPRPATRGRSLAYLRSPGPPRTVAPRPFSSAAPRFTRGGGWLVVDSGLQSAAPSGSGHRAPSRNPGPVFPSPIWNLGAKRRPAGVVQTALKEKGKHRPSPDSNLVGGRDGAKGPWTWTPKMASSPGRGHGLPRRKLEPKNSP